MQTVRFNPDDHSYWMNDERLPGITEVLRAAGIVPDVPRNDAMVRGSAIHAEIERRLRTGDTWEMEFPGHVAQAQRFLSDQHLALIAVEEVVGDRALGYATLIDAICEDSERRAWIVNWKSGGMWPHYPIQSAAEAMLWGEHCQRIGVFLTDTNYRTEQYRDPRDFAVWKAALEIHHWKVRKA